METCNECNQCKSVKEVDVFEYVYPATDSTVRVRQAEDGYTEVNIRDVFIAIGDRLSALYCVEYITVELFEVICENTEQESLSIFYMWFVDEVLKNTPHYSRHKFVDTVKEMLLRNNQESIKDICQTLAQGYKVTLAMLGDGETLEKRYSD